MKQFNRILTIVALSLTTSLLAAQDYTKSISNPSSKTLFVSEVNRVSVEAYEGNEILIETSGENKKPERAEGLKPLSARGKDNTGIGLQVMEEGDQVIISQVARRANGLFKIKVPSNMKVKIEHTGNWEGGEIEVYKVDQELEVSGRYNSIYLEDITGPALVNTVYGDIKGSFASLSQAGPTSIVSVYNGVDITLPASSQANLTIKTPYGEAYTDMDIEFPKEEGMRKISSTIKGTLNGGGTDLNIKASYNNVYLRKK